MEERQVIEIVLDELKRRNIIREVKSSYKLMEQALYLVPKIEEAIRKNKEEIKYLEKYGIPEKSKDITKYSSGSHVILDNTEKLDLKINDILQANIINASYLEKINRILDNIRSDKYFEIIELRYFKNQTIEQIADYFLCDESTIRRNRTRLINEIKELLVPNNAIDEIGY